MGIELRINNTHTLGGESGGCQGESMTTAEITELPFGPEVDRQIAEKVFGVREGKSTTVPPYSTDVAAMWELIREMENKGYRLSTSSTPGHCFSLFYKPTHSTAQA